MTTVIYAELIRQYSVVSAQCRTNHRSKDSINQNNIRKKNENSSTIGKRMRNETKWSPKWTSISHHNEHHHDRCCVGTISFLHESLPHQDPHYQYPDCTMILLHHRRHRLLLRMLYSNNTTHNNHPITHGHHDHYHHRRYCIPIIIYWSSISRYVRILFGGVPVVFCFCSTVYLYNALCIFSLLHYFHVHPFVFLCVLCVGP